MARLNERFGQEFKQWLKSQRLSGMAAAEKAELVVCVATINNWKRGWEPSEEAVRSFFAHFPEEDIGYWLSLLRGNIKTKMQNNKKASDLARDYFAQKFNCAEAVALGVTKAVGMTDDSLPRIATGFGSGAGRCGEICGALSGAMMAIGLKYGRNDPEDLEARYVTYEKVRQLLDWFREEFGSVRCFDLTGIDMSTPEGMELAKAKNLHTDFCPKFVVFAAEKAQRLLEE